MGAPFDTRLHSRDGISLAEVTGDGVIVATAGDFLTVMFDTRRLEADRAAIHAENFHPDFFNLRSGLAGELLQKLVNYHLKLAIVGDITGHLEKSEALRALVRESNRGKDVRFVATIEDAFGRWG
jgi:hypothetical protein